ncbi:protein shuttle craft [Prorops nasuta]|uniref:protein shuttle craft n=1 Tax=Prorops nasuta TaxID=863751 RepID=UPI0034CE1192
MATWNGSYLGSDDPNYFLYADQNASTSNVQDTWTYFPSRSNTEFLQNSHEFYSQTKPLALNQNLPTNFYQPNQKAPSIASNLASLENAYQNQLVPGAVSNKNATNNHFYHQEESETLMRNLLPYDSSNISYHNVPGTNGNACVFPQSLQNIEQSNLHVTAHEFVPNITKTNQEDMPLAKNMPEVKPFNNVQNVPSGRHQNSMASFKPGPSEAFFPDNRKRYENNRYDKRNSSKNKTYYNYKEELDSQSQSNNPFKKFNKTQGSKYYEKYQNDKYFGNRRMEKSYNYSQENDTRRKFTAEDNQFNLPNLGENGSALKSKHVSGLNISFKSDLNKIRKHSQENDQTVMPSMQHQNRNRKFDGSDKGFEYGEHNKNFKKSPNNKNGRYSESKKFNKNLDTNLSTQGKEIGNWKQKSDVNTKELQKREFKKKYEPDDDASQRERLTELLNRGKLECLVCCEYIRQMDFTWSCSNCYHVLHLKCIKKWAQSSTGENGWRCPACQNVNLAIPQEYFCFCGKMKEPEWDRRDTAHSCGEICGRSRAKNNCTHKCTLLCHPGSCPECIAMVTKYCGCHKSSQALKCSTVTLLLCEETCGKILNCGKHSCEKKCHHGECEPCDKKFEQECYCNQNKRQVACEADVTVSYSCKSICNKVLDCGNHKCKRLCHSEPCEPCSLVPEKITTCCCGQTLLTEKRESCLDPILTCDKICSKRLRCGQPSNLHTCQAKCHEGDCPECDLTTDVKCRCGNMDREIPCKDLTTKADDARCEKRCTKKRSCGKHKCNQFCCIDIEHICPLPCSKTLSCGRHKCEQTCHKGRCQPCWRSSFDELYCECGAAVIYPPVPCGTRRPFCERPCSREHPCGHQVLHNCHSDPTCPPCTVLTQKWCYGKHELRKAVPCHVNEISCGLSCNKPISCGRHKCINTCHPGPCEKPGQQCVQPCTNPREICGHICGAPCHEGPCPDIPCKEMVKVTCQCGHRSTTRMCAVNAKEYQKIASSILASKMADMQLGHTINLEEVFDQGARKQNQLKTLECNEECKTIERNRKLALGLQIANPDLSGKLMPRYSENMKQWAKKDPHFCQMVHEKLTDLVQLAKCSKHKSRSYSFESMNRNKRQFVHEYCEHFGCESQAYDQEPKRNVVATAVKDKCWMPSYSLIEIMQKESRQKKVPGPMLNNITGSSSVKTILSLPVKKVQKPPTPMSKSPEPEIDYFNYPGFDCKY